MVTTLVLLPSIYSLLGSKFDMAAILMVYSWPHITQQVIRNLKPFIQLKEAPSPSRT